MKKITITIMLAFIVSASIAQNGTIKNTSTKDFGIYLNPGDKISIEKSFYIFEISDGQIIWWPKGPIKGSVTPVDTTYEVYADKPLRRISYWYNTEDNKPMEVVKTDTYNGKDWHFYSITIHPLHQPNEFSIISANGSMLFDEYYEPSIKYPNGINQVGERYNKPIYPTKPVKPTRKQK